jgi:uncharacterized membrane protein YphA (DoxX/SURF4 family)
MNHLQNFKEWAEGQGDLFLDFIRVYLGIGLIIKGVFFVSNRDYLYLLMDGSGNLWFAPAAISHYVILAHICGGILLTFGLLTRIAALIQIPILMGAVFYVHLPRMSSIDTPQNLEFSALVLFLLVLIFVRGAGFFSMDFYMARNNEEEPLMVKKPVKTKTV